MARESAELQISDLLKITSVNKYAAAVAAFEVVDNAYMLDLPAKWSTRKAAVQSMMALSREIVKFDFISDEQRRKLDEELHASGHSGSAEALFRGSLAAPVPGESEDDLEEIGAVLDDRIDGADENTDADSAQMSLDDEEDEEDSEADDEDDDD